MTEVAAAAGAATAAAVGAQIDVAQLQVQMAEMQTQLTTANERAALAEATSLELRGQLDALASAQLDGGTVEEVVVPPAPPPPAAEPRKERGMLMTMFLGPHH
jgi:hypothetical protein